MDRDDAPDTIVPESTPKQTWGEKGRHIVKKFSSRSVTFTSSFSTKLLIQRREGLIGDYDYAFLFKPNLPFMKKERRAAPFFGLNDKMPVFLALLLGFQHALSMLAGVITPPIILGGAAGANFDDEIIQYLVSTSLIVCGILSSIQITRFHIYKTPYFIGTGLISVVGTSFATIPVATGALGMFLNLSSPEFLLN
jgi:hypothetical protein